MVQHAERGRVHEAPTLRADQVTDGNDECENVEYSGRDTKSAVELVENEWPTACTDGGAGRIDSETTSQIV